MMLPDPVDMAADVSARMLERHLDAWKKSAAAAMAVPGAADCGECGDAIPVGRRGPGVIRCVQCQADHELMQKRLGRG